MDLKNIHGAWLIDKPEGITSFGLIEAIQRALRAKTGLKKSELPSLGHGGTLDPFATGLLVVCVGRAVKLTRWFLGSDKTYSGRIRFGETTIPGDPTDEISEHLGRLPSPENAIAEAQAFVGREYLQIPPMHSAKKQGGKALYELARAGIEVERKPKTCTIRSFELKNFTSPSESPQSGQPVTTCDFLTEVTSGTYIRVLAQDLGQKLGTRAMLETLRRAGSGPKRLKDAIPLAHLLIRIHESDAVTPLMEGAFWVPFDRVLDGLFPVVTLTAQEAIELEHGKKVNLNRWAERNADESAKNLAFKDSEGHLRAVLERGVDGTWDIARVFPLT